MINFTEETQREREREKERVRVGGRVDVSARTMVNIYTKFYT